MQIHGIVYLIIGSFVLGFSFFVSSANDTTQKFLLFIIIGGIFVLIGIVKLLNNLARKPKVAKENFNHQVTHHHPHHHQAHNPNQPTKGAKFCSHCGSPLRSFDRFCYKCGNRLFHQK